MAEYVNSEMETVKKVIAGMLGRTNVEVYEGITTYEITFNLQVERARGQELDTYVERIKLAVQDFFTANRVVENLLEGNRQQMQKLSEQIVKMEKENKDLLKYKNYVDIQKELNGHD